MSSTPNLIFGAGGIGGTPESFTYTWITPEATSSLLDTLKELNVLELDSAASYPPGNAWHTETLLGQADAAQKGFITDSKVLVRNTRLNREGISSSIDKTLKLLGVGKIRTLYAHTIDTETPHEVTAAAFDQQWKLGKFERLGLSNYSADEMASYLAVCEKHGYVKPAVYQGEYNAINRLAEDKLLPLLREHGVKYYAFSPLAGGFLTGKVTRARDENNDNTLNRTRWKGGMAQYPNTYDQPPMHDALRKLQAHCTERALTLTEVSLRWLVHHSALHADDAFIVGATRVEQLVNGVKEARKGPLDEETRVAVDDLWNDVKDFTRSRWGSEKL
ncbi:hypothetical protein MMC25_004133 [Agyrium rufum]|nr:hypothetical protein [Agyrium rufum]